MVALEKWLCATIFLSPSACMEEIELRVSFFLDRHHQGGVWGSSAEPECVLCYDHSGRHSQVTASTWIKYLDLTSFPVDQDWEWDEWLGGGRVGSCYFSCFLLSQLNDICGSCKGSHCGEMSQASACMSLLHPPFLSLLSSLPLSSAFLF